MEEHRPVSKNTPEAKPAKDEMVKKAYAIYLKEGRPQGHAEQNWLDAERKIRNDELRKKILWRY